MVRDSEQIEMMRAAELRIVSDDSVAIGFDVVDGIVLVSGTPALDAKGKPLHHRAACSVMCQWCKRNTVTVPMQVMVRFEPALGRLMYWHGIALSWETLGAARCGECRDSAHVVTSAAGM